MTTKKDIFDHISMGCISHLESFEDIENIEFIGGEGLSATDFTFWERKHLPYKFPGDMKSFFAQLNGFSLTWRINSLIGPKTSPIGCLNIARIDDIKRVPVEGIFVETEWNASKIALPDSKSSAAFLIDSVPEVGDIVILYREYNDNSSMGECPNVWLIDMSQRWHYVCSSFSDYLRLMIAHLGVQGWQLAFTCEGLNPSTQQWMGMFCKERLCLDLYWNSKGSVQC